MADDDYTFETTKARLDEILVEVRKKDTSLEKSIELLEEGVRLANRCNELIDRTGWESAGDETEAGSERGEDRPDENEGAQDAAAVDESPGQESEEPELPEDVASLETIETVEVVDTPEGEVAMVDTIEVVEDAQGDVEVVETTEVIESGAFQVEWGWDDDEGDDERS